MKRRALLADTGQPAESDEDRHGPWNKDQQRYEDGCGEDRPHESVAMSQPDADRDDGKAAAALGPMRTNAEVIAEYQERLTPEALVLDKATRLLCEEHYLNGGRCRCGFNPRMDAFAMARHQAEAIKAAGLLAPVVPDTPDALRERLIAEALNELGWDWSEDATEVPTPRQAVEPLIDRLLAALPTPVPVSADREALREQVRRIFGDPKYGHDVQWVRINVMGAIARSGDAS